MSVRSWPDPNHPQRLTGVEAARLDTMTDADVNASAQIDPDNSPMTEAERARVEAVAALRRVRAASGLSQSAFAATYRINLARLRDLEQGRTQPDSALLAYLTVIAREPEAVRRALAAKPESA